MYVQCTRQSSKTQEAATFTILLIYIFLENWFDRYPDDGFDYKSCAEKIIKKKKKLKISRKELTMQMFKRLNIMYM